jgi:hypothetical protein
VLTAEALLNKYAGDAGNLSESNPYADESEDIPTLIFGALRRGTARLKYANGCFEEAAPGDNQWEKLGQRFWNTFQPFYAKDLVEGVLIVERQSHLTTATHDPKTGIIESIAIDVFDRDVKPKEVCSQYEDMLDSRDLRYDRSDTGQFSWKIYRGSIRVMVRPKDRNITPLSRISFDSYDVVPKQRPFPSPELVGEMYGVLRGSEAKGKFAGFGTVALPKWRPSDSGAKSTMRRGSSARAKMLIPACVAWFLVGRGRLLTPVDKPKIATVLNDVLLKPFEIKVIELSSAKSRVWEQAQQWSEFFGKVERSFTEAPLHVGRHADRYL